MRAAAAPFETRAGTGVWRLAVTWVMLLAFSLQSYVTQTHFHLASFAAERAPIVASGGKAFVQSASPAGEEAVACQLCELIAAAGVFVTPAAAASQPISDWVFTPVVAQTLRRIAARPAGFAWRSRAPPTA